MSEVKPIIEVKKLSKTYDLGIHSLGSVKQDFARFWRNLTGKERINRETSEFRALDEVSFQVQKGDIIGIMGKNGAGKSTLLKLISRITAPTSGEIVIRGKITSLLEVGTGFHPDLSGKENIFLNGAIHGMKEQILKAKYNDIVDFSGIGDFIHVPVKKYSSGMFVRLAFSVAVFLDPEILILDEVMAVGDAEFQQKCMRKIEEFKSAKLTIIFVSHDAGSVKQMCNRAILLERGKVAVDGNVDEAIARMSASN